MTERPGWEFLVIEWWWITKEEAIKKVVSAAVKPDWSIVITPEIFALIEEVEMRVFKTWLPPPDLKLIK